MSFLTPDIPTFTDPATTAAATVKSPASLPTQASAARSTNLSSVGSYSSLMSTGKTGGLTSKARGVKRSLLGG